MAIVNLTINGSKKSFDIDPQMPLLWLIRDFANLTGTKYGCGIAQCGACTVHLDGMAVRSCSLPASTVNNKSIITIEGLSKDGTHPLQLAWQEEDVPQCGYCQAGQIMTAAALLKRNPQPSDEAMTGNLCRCGTYQRIHKAIKRASLTKQGSLTKQEPLHK
jgi:aerobic-type carbon monoxide dehydrogenase small subunit (CoxS/CutS family)